MRYESVFEVQLYELEGNRLINPKFILEVVTEESQTSV